LAGWLTLVSWWMSSQLQCSGTSDSIQLCVKEVDQNNTFLVEGMVHPIFSHKPSHEGLSPCLHHKDTSWLAFQTYAPEIVWMGDGTGTCLHVHKVPCQFYSR
jgi:hypothetical protein